MGATDIPLHPLNKLPYGQLDSDKVRATSHAWKHHQCMSALVHMICACSHLCSQQSGLGVSWTEPHK